MAYMSQEKKKKIAEELKKVMKGTGIKYTLGVNNHSTIVMNIKSGPIDFIGDYIKTMKNKPYGIEDRQMQAIEGTKTQGYMQLNPYWYHEHFSEPVVKLLKRILDAMNEGNHDNSDIQSDYFDVGWYVDINVGKWDKPYVLDGAPVQPVQKDTQKEEALANKISELRYQLQEAEKEYKELVMA